MTENANRRKQPDMAANINHAIDLQSSVGTAAAILYLRAQKIHEDTIHRLVFGHWREHRVQNCLAKR